MQFHRRCTAVASVAFVACSHKFYNREQSFHRSAITRCEVLARRKHTSSIPVPFAREKMIRKNQNTFGTIYKIRESIGEGAFGKVFVAQHRHTKVLRAVKVVRKESISDWEAFSNEIKLLMELDHPHIVKLIEYFTEEDVAYLIMELCHGPDLIDRINDVCATKKYFTAEEAAVAVRHMLKAVGFCHSNGIVHNDIKPENFKSKTSDPFASLQLLDFGISRKWESETHAQSAKPGTPFYLAPEVLLDPRAPSQPASDIWSIGVIFYILLSGELPYSAKTEEAVEEIKSGEMIKSLDKGLQHQPAEAQDVLRKMLAFNPEDRISAKAALMHPFFQRSLSPPRPPEENMPSKSDESVVYNIPLADFLHDFAGRLEHFTCMPALKRVALLCLAHAGTDPEILTGAHTFRHMDLDGDGHLSLIDVQTHLTARNQPFPHDLKRIFTKISKFSASRGEPRIKFIEFIAATIPKDTYMRPENIWLVFNMLSTDEPEITSETLQRLLSDEFARYSEMIDELNSLLGNETKSITFKDFVIMMEYC